MLRTKSLGSPIAKADGLRILVARFRGRGVPASRYDVWMASLGPSETLLRSLLDGAIDWKRFSREYTKELFAPSTIDAKNRTIRNRGQLHSLRLIKHLAERQNVTLLCHCHEQETHCHRFLLQDTILGSKV